MRSRDTRLMASSVAAIALIATGCAGPEGADAAGEGGLTTVDILQPLPKSIAFYPLFVGEQLGYFEEEGLDVNLLPSGDVPATVMVTTGQADIGASNSSNIVGAAAGAENIEVVYQYYPRSVYSVIVPKSSDIQSMADLSGKTIGITSETAGDGTLVRNSLNELGLSADEVTVTVVGAGGPAIASSLKSGRIDAYSGAINDIVPLAAAGIEYRDITPDTYKSLPASSWLVSKSMLEQDPNVIQGFLRAWAKATHVGQVNGDVVFEMAKTEVPEETQDEKFGRYYVEESVKLQALPEGEDTYGAFNLDGWKFQAKIMAEAGDIQSEVDPANFLNDQFLQFANDWDRAKVEADAKAWMENNR